MYEKELIYQCTFNPLNLQLVNFGAIVQLSHVLYYLIFVTKYHIPTL